MVTWKRTSHLIAALAVVAALTACGSQPLTGTGATGTAPGTTAGQSSPAATPGTPGTPAGTPGTPPGTAGNSPAVVVHLTAGFSPAAVRLRVGQQFLLTISPSVKATVLGTAGCGSGTTWAAAGGLLSARCTSGGYLYTAEHPGTGTVSATVRPRCSPGKMCPQWLTGAQLHLTIS
jgi:hypothetical protein